MNAVRTVCHVSCRRPARGGVCPSPAYIARFRGPSYPPFGTSTQKCHASSAFFTFPKATVDVNKLGTEHIGQDVVLHGYLGPVSDMSKSLSFRRLTSIGLDHYVQLTSKTQTSSPNLHWAFKDLQQHVPVAVAGKVQAKAKPKKQQQQIDLGKDVALEVLISELHPMNDFPNQELLQASNIPVQYRHLQLRQSSHLRSALKFRSDAMQRCRNLLTGRGFTELETPLLFKSTPEGAREFLVPTRVKGKAYALPQSPQQYKQILMASGIPRYFQMAKCFRDEDLRADRQPEFTQLDLEMAFATGEDVMAVVEVLTKTLFKLMLGHKASGEPIPRMPYEDAMSTYGSDKPDTRLGMKIRRIGHLLPVDLVSKITSHVNPIVEVMKLRLDEPSEMKDFVTRFMDSPAAEPYNTNPDGQPGIFVYSSRQPMGGLFAFGFEAAEQLEQMLQLEEGDLVVIQARKNEPFSGGSTMLGNFRRDLHKAAVNDELLAPPTGWNFLWVNDFPLFSETGNSSEPGQGGTAGIASTHHPFTSPATVEDVEMLDTEPLKVKADHYDLVLNGVELGGGSRRIHDPKMQEYVLRDILKMSEERLQDFEHLLDVLRSGCPPHAGFAIGFDRLVATMLGKESIRDVIAFPKSGSGEDTLVKSPSTMTQKQLDTYHLALKD